ATMIVLLQWTPSKETLTSAAGLGTKAVGFGGFRCTPGTRRSTRRPRRRRRPPGRWPGRMARRPGEPGQPGQVTRGVSGRTWQPPENHPGELPATLHTPAFWGKRFSHKVRDK